MHVFQQDPTAPRSGAALLAPALLIVAALALALGCSDPPPGPPHAKQRAGASPPPAAVRLTVLVVADESLAEGVRLLSGEWKARSGGELNVAAMALEELAAAEELPADVVIFPSRWLGALAERGALRPMRDSVLSDPRLALSDIYPAIRAGEMQYGGQTMALPLGSPPLLVYRQAGLADSAEAMPTTPPLAGLAAAHTLIARSLPYIEAPRRAEALFDPQDMSPRIAGPPWVRALTEIVEGRSDETETQPLDFSAAMALVRTGKSLATLGWPGLPSDEAADADQAAGAEFAPLPVAESTYSETRQEWENQRRPQSVTLLGVAGRLIAVTQSSRNAVSAFSLCQWLTSGDVAVRLSSRSDRTLWYRRSQAAEFGRWLDGRMLSDAATPVTEVVADALETETPVLIPRIPGIDAYLEALAEAVRTAEPGEAGAREALEAAAAKWEEITERLGREAQTRSYQRHLGIEAFEL